MLAVERTIKHDWMVPPTSHDDTKATPIPLFQKGLNRRLCATCSPACVMRVERRRLPPPPLPPLVLLRKSVLSGFKSRLAATRAGNAGAVIAETERESIKSRICEGLRVKFPGPTRQFLPPRTPDAKAHNGYASARLME